MSAALLECLPTYQVYRNVLTVPSLKHAPKHVPSFPIATATIFPFVTLTAAQLVATSLRVQLRAFKLRWVHTLPAQAQIAAFRLMRFSSVPLAHRLSPSEHTATKLAERVLPERFAPREATHTPSYAPPVHLPMSQPPAPLQAASLALQANTQVNLAPFHAVHALLELIVRWVRRSDAAAASIHSNHPLTHPTVYLAWARQFLPLDRRYA